MLGYVGIGTLSEGTCRYDLNEEDVAWLEVANKEFGQMGECCKCTSDESVYLSTTAEIHSWIPRRLWMSGFAFF